jgi:hypothetical protein
MQGLRRDEVREQDEPCQHAGKAGHFPGRLEAMDLSHKWGVKFGHQRRSSEAVSADPDAWSAHGDTTSEEARIEGRSGRMSFEKTGGKDDHKKPAVAPCSAPAGK